ncbi:YfhO family protein [Flavobacterium sp. MAH-1]|uniref:YfhO family protein n=1 Tax=Flavobacterium agri TaxID=2743471 RepID=A0A7Y9C5G4_9FLAO|nr:YfhO family protein [Flavobacterium agri]NUY79309.1 YfhO family protein [Flavobacterium agri]NYA69333.1 YfhO family protein [Flavobacterium agri]
MKQISKYYPHLIAIVGFVLVSLIYFYPVLSGKKLYQSDIAQFTGMAKEQNDFRAAGKGEPYWTNSSFGGMPTYQMGANYQHDYIGKLDDLLRFLPRPADYLFLYFLGFYSLLLVLKTDPLKAFLGALAFGFSTYMIVILGVGHNAKAHAIAYMPMVVAGVLLVFRRKYITGGLLTMIAAALEINANHFQMTYYLLFLLLAIVVYYLYKAVKQKDFKPLLVSFGIFAGAGILAVGVNASNLLATAEYTDFSIRGKSELTFKPDGSANDTKSAMEYDYITEYSYGILESFNLIAPRLFGGSNGEKLDDNSATYEFLISQGVPQDQAQHGIDSMPLYWGDQPLVAAPAYIGAVVFFLAILAFFVDDRKIKYAFLAGAILSLLLSWGKNFPALTNFFIDYVPLYDKFRAVSSIQVVLELCVPVLAVMGLQSFFASDKQDRLKKLYMASGVFIGIMALLLVIKGQFTFGGGSDDMLRQSYGPEFVDALKKDRSSFYSADLLRSTVLVLAAAAALWFFLKNKISQTTALVIVGVVMIGDLFFIDKNYVEADDFVDARYVDMPFEPTQVDQAIMQDTTHYRVFEINAIHNARTSYFHKSLSGYSAVRPRRMEQLLEYQIAKNNLEVLNLLNTKYVIQTNEKGEEFAIPNPDANGNAWFVKQVNEVTSADAEMKALDKLDSKNVAVVNAKEFGKQLSAKTFAKDSTASIQVVKYEPNHLKYKTDNANAGLAVFSEMYYPYGWNAYVDGKKAEILRADYVLRALSLPAGKHTVEFKFEPQVVRTGGNITLGSSVLMLLLAAAGIYFERKKKQAAH